MWVVRDGLNPGHRVIVDGCSKGRAWHASETETITPEETQTGAIEGRSVELFIKRPIVAMVISILMVIVGAVTIATSAGAPISEHRSA